MEWSTKPNGFRKPGAKTSTPTEVLVGFPSLGASYCIAPLNVGKANRATTTEAEKKLSINRPDLEILPGTPPFVFDPMLMYNSPLSPNTILFKAFKGIRKSLSRQ